MHTCRVCMYTSKYAALQQVGERRERGDEWLGAPASHVAQSWCRCREISLCFVLKLKLHLWRHHFMTINRMQVSTPFDDDPCLFWPCLYLLNLILSKDDLQFHGYECKIVKWVLNLRVLGVVVPPHYIWLQLHPVTRLKESGSWNV